MLRRVWRVPSAAGGCRKAPPLVGKRPPTPMGESVRQLQWASLGSWSTQEVWPECILLASEPCLTKIRACDSQVTRLRDDSGCAEVVQIHLAAAESERRELQREEGGSSDDETAGSGSGPRLAAGGG